MNKNMGFLLIAVGMLLAVLGIVVIQKSSKSEDSITTQKTIEKAAITETKSEKTHSSTDLSVAEQKGQDFEKYVVNNFPTKYYTIKEWRSDKYSNGRYATSNQYPDLEIALNYKGEEYMFAVECKWRSTFNNDGYVYWCNDDQLERYNNYSKDKNIPVFVILGIGGTPSEPENVYCVPLKAMKYSNAKKDYIEGFKHDISKSFYYHLKEERLD